MKNSAIFHNQRSTVFMVMLLSQVSFSNAMAQDFTFPAERIAGTGSAVLQVDVVNPGETTGDAYQIFVTAVDGQFLFSVENLSTQTVVVDMLPLETTSQVFEGLTVTALTTPSQIIDLQEISYGGTAVEPPIAIFRPGDREGDGGPNSTNEYTFVGGGGAGGFSRIARNETNTAFSDYEIRFDGNPLGRNKFVYGFTRQGTIDIPFSVWNIGVGTPDDSSDDRQVIAVGFDDSGNPAIYDGGAQPSDGGPGTMFDRIYIFDIQNNDLGGDINGDGVVNYDDFLRDLENKGGDLSLTLLSQRPNYLGPEILARFSMVSLTGDVSFIPPPGTTIRITTSKPIADSDVYQFTSPSFGLFTEQVALDFGDVGQNTTSIISLVVRNRGAGITTVSNITTGLPEFAVSQTSFAVAPGESDTVDVSFTPGEIGLREVSLTLFSDDAFFPEYAIPLQGRGVGNFIRFRGHLDIPGGNVADIWGFVDENTGIEYALVGSNSNSVSIIDVSDPTQPALTAQVTGVPGFDVKSWRNYVYCVTGGFGVNQGRVLDVSDPANPQIVGDFDSSHNIFITDDGFMVLEIPGTRVFDLNPDPTEPVLLWTGGFGSAGHDATVVDNILYSFHGGAGTFIYDFSDRANPVLLSAITDPTISFHHSGWPSKDGNFLFITDELANDPSPDIIVYDISDLTNPKRVGGFGDPNATVHNAFVVGDRLYTSYYAAGYRVFDISNPAVPVLADEFDTDPNESGETFAGAWGAYPFAPSGNVYVSDINGGLFVFSTPGPPTSVRGDDSGTPRQFTLFNNYPNPFNPETIISYQLPRASQTSVIIYNTLGQRVRRLVDKQENKGLHQVSWDGKNDAGLASPSGIYFYRIKAGGFSEARRMTLLK